MASEEEKALENQLELQLQEQKDSLSALNDALAADPSNLELLSVQEELIQAIKDAEDGLLHLKRARLLQEFDSGLHGSFSKHTADNVKVEPLDRVKAEPLYHIADNFKEELLDSVKAEPFDRIADNVKEEPLDPSEVEPEPLEDQSYSVGSKCRFRYNDGRWYNGKIVEFEGSNTAKVSFLTPTSENMLMCKFFLQQRCRFGTTCRLSHGFNVSVSSLKEYIPTTWDQSLVGSSIWAAPDNDAGLWRRAELESWDDRLRVGNIVFCDDGSSAKLGSEAITLSTYALKSDSEECDSSSAQSDSSDYEEEASQGGLGFLESSTLQRGIQTETAIFAKWENHTRGIASKMMANMGYRDGMGLGASGQGMVNPISVKVLPAKQSLDHTLQSQNGEEITEDQPKKRRSRGGKRKRDKRLAALARADEEGEEEMGKDVFSLINNQLAKHDAAVNGRSAKKNQNNSSGDKKVDRRALVAYDDEVKELRMRVQKLEEMATRNKREKPVYEAAMRKLNETRKALAEAEAVHASASKAVTSKEKEKKWLKF